MCLVCLEECFLRVGVNLHLIGGKPGANLIRAGKLAWAYQHPAFQLESESLQLLHVVLKIVHGNSLLLESAGIQDWR